MTSPTPTATLSTWLLERADEAEALALATQRVPVDAGHGWHTVDALMGDGKWPQDAAFMAAIDPAHVLDQVASLRALVGLHSNPDYPFCPLCSDDGHGHEPTLSPCPTLRAAALAFRRHPGWRGEWAL